MAFCPRSDLTVQIPQPIPKLMQWHNSVLLLRRTLFSHGVMPPQKCRLELRNLRIPSFLIIVNVYRAEYAAYGNFLRNERRHTSLGEGGAAGAR